MIVSVDNCRSVYQHSRAKNVTPITMNSELVRCCAFQFQQDAIWWVTGIQSERWHCGRNSGDCAWSHHVFLPSTTVYAGFWCCLLGNRLLGWTCRELYNVHLQRVSIESWCMEALQCNILLLEIYLWEHSLHAPTAFRGSNINRIVWDKV